MDVAVGQHYRKPDVATARWEVQRITTIAGHDHAHLARVGDRATEKVVATSVLVDRREFLLIDESEALSA